MAGICRARTAMHCSPRDSRVMHCSVMHRSVMHRSSMHRAVMHRSARVERRCIVVLCIEARSIVALVARSARSGQYAFPGKPILGLWLFYRQ